MMQAKMYSVLTICIVALSGCSKGTLSKNEAARELAGAVTPGKRTVNLQMHKSEELTNAVQRLINQNKLKEVGAVAGFMAFAGHSDPTEATVNYNGNDVFVKCPIVTESFGSVTSILTNSKAGVAQVEYTIIGTPEEPYYSAFKNHAPELPAFPTTRTQSAVFQKFDEGWRLVRK